MSTSPSHVSFALEMPYTDASIKAPEELSWSVGGGGGRSMAVLTLHDAGVSHDEALTSSNYLQTNMPEIV